MFTGGKETNLDQGVDDLFGANDHTNEREV